MHDDAQRIRILASSITANLVREHTLITVFMQGLAEGPFRHQAFRLELDTLELAISAAEQEGFSMIKAHVIPNFYRLGSKRPRSSDNKRLQKCNRFQKLGHYAYEYSTPRPVPNSTERNDRPFDKKGNRRRSNAVAKPQQRSGPSKNGRDQ